MIPKSHVAFYLEMVRSEQRFGVDFPTVFFKSTRAEARARLGKPVAYRTKYLIEDLEILQRSWIRRKFIPSVLREGVFFRHDIEQRPLK
jgi:hypothetical protein